MNDCTLVGHVLHAIPFFLFVQNVRDTDMVTLGLHSDVILEMEDVNVPVNKMIDGMYPHGDAGFYTHSEMDVSQN
jgi:hypothetical protein